MTQLVAITSTPTLPAIVTAAGEQPFTLRVRWAHGEDSVIDVSAMIETFRLYAPLRSDPSSFAAVKVGEYGTHVAWTDDIDMAASTLWRLAQEQSGATITADPRSPADIMDDLNTP